MPPRLVTCSATAARVSKTRTMAPMFLAVPTADRPATPPPTTSTCTLERQGQGAGQLGSSCARKLCGGWCVLHLGLTAQTKKDDI